DLRAHHHLVGVHGANQLQTVFTAGGCQVIDERSRENHAQEDYESVALAHGCAPFLAELLAFWNSAAETKSSTAARRAAMRSGESGSPGAIMAIRGALAKYETTMATVLGTNWKGSTRRNSPAAIPSRSTSLTFMKMGRK